MKRTNINFWRVDLLFKNGLNFIQLTSLIATPTSIPFLLIGDRIGKQTSPGTAISSIFIGNLILWLIGIAVISMVDKSHSNAIDNIKVYLGKFGGALIAFILLFAFLNWYALQINASMVELNQFFHFDALRKDIPLRIGAFLGIISALFAIGGIRLFSSIAIVCLPLFFSFYLYLLISQAQSISFSGTWSLSLSGIISTILLTLSGFINLPTIFKYSRSRAHSYLALTVITILLSFLEISSIWIKFSDIAYQSTTNLILFSVYFCLTLATSNLLNIFFASACWTGLFHKFGGPKGYAIIGLIGTLVYTFFQIAPPIQFFDNLINSYLACLGVMLMAIYLVRIFVKHRPRPFEKTLNLTIWLIGCAAATIHEAHNFPAGINSFLVGTGTSLLSFLLLLFIEETAWAIKVKLSKRISKKDSQ